MMDLRPAPPGYRLFEVAFDLNQGFGVPQVAYRETLGRRAEIDYTHKKQNVGTCQFARLKLIFEPLPPGSGIVFDNCVVGDSIPKEFIPGVEKGIRAVAGSGPLLGFPVIDFKVSLIDGAYHDVDSSVLAFEIAARAAFRSISEKVGMNLLEPIMKIEVVSPADCVGVVVGELTSRRGTILERGVRGADMVVGALAPYANLTNFSASLQVKTNGRARCSGDFAGLALAPLPDRDPPAIAARMIA
jgi:elongation factor G